MVGREPALGNEQMKAGPRSAHRANTIIQRLPIGFVDLIEVPGVRRIETHQVDGDRGVATAPPGHADADHDAAKLGSLETSDEDASSRTASHWSGSPCTTRPRIAKGRGSLVTSEPG